MKLFTYYLFTSARCPYEIAKSWFDDFREKNMAACLVKHTNIDHHIEYHVWVEYDPTLFGEHKIAEEKRRRRFFGFPVESCGGFLERLDRETGKLAPRTDYSRITGLENLTGLGGEKDE